MIIYLKSNANGRQVCCRCAEGSDRLALIVSSKV